ncbi:unnamed protein product [Rotaria sp. Silwood2]|nr:unnamed protein product [Rotaria sp. Silwood2]
MVVGGNHEAYPQYTTVLMPLSFTEHEQVESGYNSTASTSSLESLPKIKRLTTGQQSKHVETQSRASVSARQSISARHQIPQPMDPAIRYRNQKAAHSLISVNKMISQQFKTIETNTSINHSHCLRTSSKCQEESTYYSDDWEPDYSDDSISDSEDSGEPSLKKASEFVNVSPQKESRSEGITNKEEESIYKNASTQKETADNLKTNSSSDTLCLIPLDSNAFEATFCQQRQAAIDNMNYRRAVKSWKAKNPHDIIKLILELSSGKSVIDRAWIVFYWVSQNIEYDVDAYFSGNIRHQSTDDLFRSGKGVCDAFGTIFETLCNGVGIECKKISGYAKGYSFKLETSAFHRTNHAWNAVRLDGHWYLVDSTWGEGHIDNRKQNVRKLCTFYFLVRPEQLIYTHLPENPQWQLLKSPIAMKDFVYLPHVYPEYFELGLHMVSPYH